MMQCVGTRKFQDKYISYLTEVKPIRLQMAEDPAVRLVSVAFKGVLRFCFTFSKMCGTTNR